MALTYTNRLDRAYNVMGHRKQVEYSILFDSSYPTGGEAVTASSMGLNAITSAQVTGISFDGVQTTNVSNASWDQANQKIQLWDETPAEVGNTNDASGTTVRLTAFGY